jgi:xanthine dehydrogenase accessory factor
MNSQFFEQVTQLKRDGASFVVATVVSRRAPVSSHLGDRALIHSDGRMEGFVGGSCSREIVRKQSLEVLRLGKPRLVLIRPDATLETLQHAADAESIVVPMTCASEGAVDVYLEPHTPAKALLVVGFTPVAQAVAKLGTLLEYDVTRVVTREEMRDLETEGHRLVALPDLENHLEQLPIEVRSSMAAVVASQGHYDEPTLEPLLKNGVGFVGLLASRKRALTVRELLELQGLDVSLTAKIRNPIGLDLGAKTPAEVAVSILAEIIQHRSSDAPMFTNSSSYDAEKHRAKVNLASIGRPQGIAPTPQDFVGAGDPSDPGPSGAAVGSRSPLGAGLGSRGLVPARASTTAGTEFAIGLPSERPGFAISPVDHEEIEIASAIHFADLEGVRYFFTCPNCKRRFLKNPQSYLNPGVNA